MAVSKSEFESENLPDSKDTFSITQSQLELLEELESGSFGPVFKGYCTLKQGIRIPIAVRKLECDAESADELSIYYCLSTQELSADIHDKSAALLKGANMMKSLSHPRIVRMIGLCSADCIMLVLELCLCGPLNFYLSKHKKTKQSSVVQLMYQVAQGMSYLHSKNFVHRDLRANNVLLMSEFSAKISNFTMSRELDLGENFYQSEEASRGPLKWCAPECVYYWTFDTKSDVWSYGVTLWEATSLGEDPYKKMTDNEILKFLVEDGKRLPKPELCDDEVYQIMLNCWEYDKKKRPSFEEIEEQIKQQYQRLMKAPTPPARTLSQVRGRPPLPVPSSKEAANWTGGNWEQPEDNVDKRINIDMDVNKLEKIYDDLPRTKETFSIRQSQLELEEELSSGQFGSVQKGYCTLKREGRIPVAVKILKSDDKSAEEEMLKEADLMRNLSHSRIVRMIGLCRADCIMLVLELCPCGPLNSYLSKHKQIKQSTVVQLMYQVAQGMSYLHSKNYVHRDLAARNVLLVSESSAKISDFGMSKALNIGNDYYKAEEAGKWPLKWYAPECVYYWKFDSKSDVWSYGVTLWEATSLGEKPYRKMKGNEILKFLVEDGKRLAKPELCDDQVYHIMLNCWEYEKKERPSFEEIEARMKQQFQRLLSMNR